MDLDYFKCVLAVLLLITQIQSTDDVFAYAVKEMECDATTFQLSLQVPANFEGVLFSRNHFGNKKCKWFPRDKLVNITIKDNECDLKRESEEYLLNLVMSPEKNLLVAGSKQLLIKCNSSRSTRKNNIAEAEFEEIVVNMNPSVDKSNQIKLKQIESDTLTGTGITPKVFLLITKGQNESSLGVSRAKIGQSLKLMVQFEEAKLFNFMVTNCFSDDGKNTSGAHLSIIDKKGCAVALPRAIGDKVHVTTTKNTKSVFVYIYGFQFTTSSDVFFECTVKTCIQPCQVKQCNADTKEIEEDDSIKEHTNQEFNTMQVKYKLAIEP